MYASFSLEEDERGEIGMPEVRSLSAKQKERVENPIRQMPGTPLTQERRERDRAVLEAAARPAEHGTHSGYLHAAHGPVEEQDPRDVVCTVSPGTLTSRAEFTALRCPSADLPANRP